jgi:hypothetical protein
MRLFALALLATLTVAGTALAEKETDETDPWTGKSRSEVIQLLGKPDKTKKSGNGTETLVYKLYRVDPDVPPSPAALLLHVPGVGLVARVDKRLTRAADPMQIEPTELDEQGRRVGGGTTPSRSASTSYNPETGKVEKDWDGPDNPPVKGKLSLKFFLDAAGRVTKWTK